MNEGTEEIKKDKSLPELEKELEEAVNSVEVSQSLQNEATQINLEHATDSTPVDTKDVENNKIDGAREENQTLFCEQSKEGACTETKATVESETSSNQLEKQLEALQEETANCELEDSNEINTTDVNIEEIKGENTTDVNSEERKEMKDDSGNSEKDNTEMQCQTNDEKQPIESESETIESVQHSTLKEDSSKELVKHICDNGLNEPTTKDTNSKIESESESNISENKNKKTTEVENSLVKSDTSSIEDKEKEKKCEKEKEDEVIVTNDSREDDAKTVNVDNTAKGPSEEDNLKTNENELKGNAEEGESIQTEEHSGDLEELIDSNVQPEIIIVNTSEDIEIIEAEVAEIKSEEVNKSKESEVSLIEHDDDVSAKKKSVEETVLLNSSDEAQKQKKTEKAIKIPCHVLGRNVENPTVDSAGNGRVPPKPRLGVKIPYRNLTSQIVSKQEIAEEIMERSRQRNATLETPSGDVFFARKLTQRLAQKLAAAEKTPEKTPKTVSSDEKNAHVSANSQISKTKHPEKDAKSKEIPETSVPTSAKIKQNDSPKSTSKPTVINVVDKNVSAAVKQQIPIQKEKKSEITDNSDLLAILEGDGDVDLPELQPKTYSVKTSVPIISNKDVKPSVSVQPKLNTLKTPQLLEQKKVELPPGKVENKHTIPTNKNDTQKGNEQTIEKDDDFNSEPKFSSSLVTKTYTRKRKPSEDINFANQLPANKKQLVINNNKTPVDSKINIDLAPNTYISKSSRIVKRKVIWDPDEAIPMSKLLSSKPRIESKSINEKTVTKAAEKKVVKTEKVATPITVDKKQTKPQTIENAQDKTIKKVSRTPTDKVASKKVITNSTDKPSTNKGAVSEKVINKNVILNATAEKATPKKSIVSKKSLGSTVKKTPMKAKQQLPKSKRLSEIDRLLMDEGAVNMLYSVKNIEESENSNRLKSRKKSVISIDNFQQELLDRTNEIKNDLQMNSNKESPKSLRKKENVIPFLKKAEIVNATPVRKKSKDSVRNSVHSPPASPAYAFTQSAEASRIIRRHSSSSFSSSQSESANDENKSVNNSLQSKSNNAEKGGTKLGKHKGSVAAIVKSKRVKLTKENASLKKQKQKLLGKNVSNETEGKSVVSNTDTSIKTEHFKTISFKRFDNLVQIVLSPNTSCQFSEQVLTEISNALQNLSKDKSCKVVMISSAANAFCQGLDYKTLIEENETKRKRLAESLAYSLRNFFLSLASFPKLLVAGVHGNTIGLGVTMLPLFDMVLASDSATFRVPHAHLGCIAEGASLLAQPNMMHNALISELLFASRKLTAAEALRFGLVTRTLWPDKFQEELISTLKVISEQPSQGLTSMKKMLRQRLLSEVDSLLTMEVSTLVQQWTSAECQSNFSNYRLEDE